MSSATIARNDVAPAARISVIIGAKAAARSDAIWTLGAPGPKRNFLSSGRDIMRLTCVRDQLALPRAVGMPRWLSSAAISRNVTAPAARISAMIGAKAAARSDAIRLLAVVAAANLAAKTRSRVVFRPRERPLFVDVNSSCRFMRRLSLATAVRHQYPAISDGRSAARCLCGRRIYSVQTFRRAVQVFDTTTQSCTVQFVFFLQQRAEKRM